MSQSFFYPCRALCKFILMIKYPAFYIKKLDSPLFCDVGKKEQDGNFRPNLVPVFWLRGKFGVLFIEI
jgi:hypothetical protein